MFREVLLFSVAIPFMVSAMNPTYDQKAFNRRARSYVESVLVDREISRESLVGSLQFLSEEALKDPINTLLADESVFLATCQRASVIDKLKVFTELCKSVFSSADLLKKIQISMLLNAVFSMMPKSTSSSNGLEKFMSLSGLFPMPID